MALRVKAKVTLCRSNEDVGHCRHPSSFPLTSTPSELLLQHLRSNLLVFESAPPQEPGVNNNKVAQ